MVLPAHRSAGRGIDPHLQEPDLPWSAGETASRPGDELREGEGRGRGLCPRREAPARLQDGLLGLVHENPGPKRPAALTNLELHGRLPFRDMRSIRFASARDIPMTWSDRRQGTTGIWIVSTGPTIPWAKCSRNNKTSLSHLSPVRGYNVTPANFVPAAGILRLPVPRIRLVGDAPRTSSDMPGRTNRAVAIALTRSACCRDTGPALRAEAPCFRRLGVPGRPPSTRRSRPPETA